MNTEYAHLTSIKEALVTLRTAAAEVEAMLPDEILSLKWQKAKHSPTPWESAHASLLVTTYDPITLRAVWVRAQIAEAMELLTRCVVQSEADAQPIGSLQLAKTRRLS